MWWIEVTKCLNYLFTKPCLCVWLVQFGETHSFHNYCQETHPAVQCAAVMTHCSLIRVPPHHGDTFCPACGLREVRATCHPSVLTTAFSPPTIRCIKSSIASRLATSNLFWPQTAKIAEVFSSWGHLRQIQMILLTALRVSIMQLRATKHQISAPTSTHMFYQFEYSSSAS